MKPFLLTLLLVSFYALCCVAQLTKTHLIPVADSKVYAEERGSGETLVLLHAGNMDHRMWKYQLDALKRYRTVAIDLRGCGDTQDGDSTYLQSAAIAAVMDSLHIQKASLAGVSLGAVSATEFALDYPERVDKLVLISPGMTGIDLNHDSTLVRYYRLMDSAWKRHDTTAYVNFFANAWIDGPLRKPEAMDKRIRQELLLMASHNIRKRREGVHLGFTFEPDQLHRLNSPLQAPVLVIRGSLDMVDIKMVADEWKKQGAKVVVIPGAAHMVNAEKPKAVNEQILSFLSGR